MTGTGGSATPDALAERLRVLTADPARAAVLSDIDGTLAPIVERPGDACVPREVSRLLGELAQGYRCVACISGRRAAEARRLVGQDRITYVGLHGAEELRPGQSAPRVAPAFRGWEDRVRAFCFAHDTPELRRLGVRIEDKGPIMAFHWRGVPDEDAALAHLEDVGRDARSQGLATHKGRKVLEVRPPIPVDKGLAVRHLVTSSGPEVALYGGDDATDLDAFDALDALVGDGRLAAAVRVGVRSEEGPEDIVARADVVVEGTKGFTGVLRCLARRAARGTGARRRGWQ